MSGHKKNLFFFLNLTVNSLLVFLQFSCLSYQLKLLCSHWTASPRCTWSRIIRKSHQVSADGRNSHDPLSPFFCSWLAKFSASSPSSWALKSGSQAWLRRNHTQSLQQLAFSCSLLLDFSFSSLFRNLSFILSVLIIQHLLTICWVFQKGTTTFLWRDMERILLFPQMDSTSMRLCQTFRTWWPAWPKYLDHSSFKTWPYCFSTGFCTCTISAWQAITSLPTFLTLPYPCNASDLPDLL